MFEYEYILQTFSFMQINSIRPYAEQTEGDLSDGFISAYVWVGQ